jgi:hypothetical protein
MTASLMMTTIPLTSAFSKNAERAATAYSLAYRAICDKRKDLKKMATGKQEEFEAAP